MPVASIATIPASILIQTPRIWEPNPIQLNPNML